MQRTTVSHERLEDWQQLDRLVSRAAANGLGSLSEAELWELPSLYRRALADLSLLRSSAEASQEQQWLAQLATRAHGLIYARSSARQGRRSLLQLLQFDVPAAIRRRAAYVWLAGSSLLAFAALGWLHALLAPAIVEQVLPAQAFRAFEAELETASEMADLKLAAQIEREARPFASLRITLNNIRVSAIALAVGIAGGALTLLVLAMNGYLLGVIGSLYFTAQSPLGVNLPLYFAAGIAPHGSIELPAIFLAGGAGLLLGTSWLFPGQHPRGESLRSASPDALLMLLGSVVTLLVAGAIEGFVTPLNPPQPLALEVWFVLKIAFGAVVLAGWLSWLGQRQRPTPGSST